MVKEECRENQNPTVVELFKKFESATEWSREQIAWNFIRFNTEYRQLYKAYDALPEEDKLLSLGGKKNHDHRERRKKHPMRNDLRSYLLRYFIDPNFEYDVIESIRAESKSKTIYDLDRLLDGLRKYGPSKKQLNENQLGYIFEINRSLEQQASECLFMLKEIAKERNFTIEPKDKFYRKNVSDYLSLVAAQFHGYSNLDISKGYSDYYKEKAISKNLSSKQVEQRLEIAYKLTHANGGNLYSIFLISK